MFARSTPPARILMAAIQANATGFSNFFFLYQKGKKKGVTEKKYLMPEASKIIIKVSTASQFGK